ncbi:hypothetical protein [Streptomyces sp. NPDC057690]|uniref:hypothetical protein n=1 Tax=Streptomyces sp. NPDC057690 TaxID=3346214 RepID=UPI0036AEBA63
MPPDPPDALDASGAFGAFGPLDVLGAIDAVNWSEIPRPTSHACDEPERVGQALRQLALSTTANRTGDAAALLAGGGFVHGHSGMVFPAAYEAAPILLDLVEHGPRPQGKSAALGLLSEALGCLPATGHNRVDTPYGTDVPLCCAIARHIRGRREALVAHGRGGVRLLTEADRHWRLTIDEAEPQADGTLIALAVLEGSLQGTPVAAEVHPSPSTRPASTSLIESLTADATGAACVRLGAAPPAGVPAGSVLHPAECGLRGH